MRQRLINKITPKSTILNEKRITTIKKMKLQVWRQRFRLLRARILVQKIATKSRRKLARRQKAYRKSLFNAARLKKRTSHANRTLIRRGRQFTPATLSTQAFRVVGFSGMRRRVKISRRLIRLRVKSYVPFRTKRVALKLLRRALRASRRIYYLQKQRPTYRRPRLRAALHDVRYSVSGKYGIEALRGEYSRVRGNTKKLRRFQHARWANRRRRRWQRQHRPRIRQRRRTLQVHLTKTRPRLLRVLTAKRFSV